MHNHSSSIQYDCHTPAIPSSGEQEKRMLLTFFLTFTVMITEGIAAWYSQSLALWADAGHMLTDLLALLISVLALILSRRPADDRRTYGYHRLEVLAALLNSIALLWVCKNIIQEAYARLFYPTAIDIPLMLSVAAFGFVANLAGLALLGHHHHHNINIRGAFLHIVGDTLSSLAVVLGGILMKYTGLMIIDPILSLLISIVIIVTSIRLLREILEVLLEAAPLGMDTKSVRKSILGIEGVTGIHDLHIWSITSGITALSAHVHIGDLNEAPIVLQKIEHVLLQQFHIQHTTLQFETSASVLSCKNYSTTL
jgi:cobalt-zinc-cadmium efflux system protein